MTFTATALRCLLLIAPATADPVRAAADEAAVLVREARYDDAMKTLDDAEAKQKDPVFVYMRGVVEEERGNCEAATAHYEEYLALDIPEVDAKEARRRRARCERLLESRKPPPPTVQPDTEPPLAESRRPLRPWYADPAGLVLTAVGTTAVAAGAGIYAQALSDENAAKRATVLEMYDERGTRAERLSRAGIATMSIGGAIVLAGIIRYAIVGAKRRKQRTARALRYKNYSGTLALFR